MGQCQPNAWFTRFKRFMAPEAINALGARVGLCQRQRRITPWRLAYKPFHKQLAKPAFAEFMRALAGELLDRLRVQVLQAQPGGVFDAFVRIVIQDGSSFALKDDLAPVYPGRFHTQAPAAVEWHTTLELYDGAPSRIGLTPDTDPERAH